MKLDSGVEFCEKQRDILLGYFVITTRRMKKIKKKKKLFLSYCSDDSV